MTDPGQRGGVDGVFGGSSLVVGSVDLVVERWWRCRCGGHRRASMTSPAPELEKGGR